MMRTGLVRIGALRHICGACAVFYCVVNYLSATLGWVSFHKKVA